VVSIAWYTGNLGGAVRNSRGGAGAETEAAIEAATDREQNMRARTHLLSTHAEWGRGGGGVQRK
jgi:hypothetical protein